MGIRETIEKKVSNLVKRNSGTIAPILLKLHSEKKQILVFYFHSLFRNEEEKKLNHIDPQNNLSADEFTMFLEYFLHHGYAFISPDDLSGNFQGRPSIMVTFDDGYFNNSIAIELLTKYKIPGTFFITAKNIIENKSYWWDIIYKFRIKEGASRDAISREQVYMKSLGQTAIEDYIIKNFGKDSFSPWSDIDRPMTTFELQNISKNPFVFLGNHTFSHAILTNCDIEMMKTELQLCDNFLLTHTGKKPETVSFPNGNYNEDVLSVALEYGFKYAFTVEHGLNYPPTSNDKLALLKRFLPPTGNLKRNAALNRIGTTPERLYFDLKRKFSTYFFQRTHQKN